MAWSSARPAKGDPLEHDETPAEEKGKAYSTATLEAPTTRDPKSASRPRTLKS